MVRVLGLRGATKRGIDNNRADDKKLSDLPNLSDSGEPLSQSHQSSQYPAAAAASSSSESLAHYGDILSKHPMYRYAVAEFSQTVQTGTSNDDGMMDVNMIMNNNPTALPQPPSALSGVRQDPPPIEESSSIRAQPSSSAPQSPQHNSDHRRHQRLQQNLQHVHQHNQNYPSSSVGIPDSTYEEYYGDAYTGAPLKYVYPSGYQNMRPRSCPWKLSIFICLSFTWLSIFIVGHCSNQGMEDYGYGTYYNTEIDDDSLVIETRWCGSRPLYWLWVCSMLITGLAAAYCSVIGYIKVRDFAVANSRSQPPGVAGVEGGKSDYYLRIEDGGHPSKNIGRTLSNDGSMGGQLYKKTIYQADGTPQFWGAHIYRPTQAAVAITSR